MDAMIALAAGAFVVAIGGLGLLVCRLERCRLRRQWTAVARHLGPPR